MTSSINISFYSLLSLQASQISESFLCFIFEYRFSCSLHFVKDGVKTHWLLKNKCDLYFFLWGGSFVRVHPLWTGNNGKKKHVNTHVCPHLFSLQPAVVCPHSVVCPNFFTEAYFGPVLHLGCQGSITCQFGRIASS